MFVSFRNFVMMLAAVVPASMAPAQVFPVGKAVQAGSQEPGVLLASNEIPKILTPTLIDPPAPSATPAPADADPEVPLTVKKIPGESLHAMVARLGSLESPTHERECLATAIYFEAKSEPLAGQLAVGEVLANRVKSGRFAGSYCGVVMQRGQFSFIRNHSLPRVPRSAQWRNAVAIATIVDGRMMNSAAPRALFFHAKRVAPNWSATRVATIGNHIFYR